MKLHGPVTGGPCWAELGTGDLEAAKRFYAELFGWRPRRTPGSRRAVTPSAGWTAPPR